jgi:hypothetical protein
MPRLPVLTASNVQEHLLWHQYIADVYHEPISGQTSVDLNTFTFFYKGKPATTQLLSPAFDPCIEVCELRSWPDRPEVYDGTLFEGDSGPEGALAEFGFFVVRPFITKAEALACQSLEVMHVRTEWLDGEHGASWFFHTVGSGVHVDCHHLPMEGAIGVYRNRDDWLEEHGWWDWQADGDKKILERMEMDGYAMLIFTAADFSVFNQEGNNPSTEIIIRHRASDSNEMDSPRRSCLDDSEIGMPLRTGLAANLPCKCDVRNSPANVNCDLSG